MTIRLWPQLILVTLVVILTACGGGGGGGGGTNPPQPTPLSSALEFKTPSTFANGEAYVTQGSLVSITGGLNSSSTPSGFCPDTQPPQDYSVRWNNAANGDSGSTPIGIVCVTISGIPGIRSQFITDSILLELGNNRITFDTFQGSTQVGRDVISVVREDSAPPRISVAYPIDGQLMVPTNHALVVVFSEPMNASTLTADRFTVVGAGGAAVTGQLAYLAASNTWTLRPDTLLSPDSSYKITISGAVEDTGGGNSLGDDVSWSFVTGPVADDTPPFVDTQWPGSNCDCAPASTRILAGLSEFADPGSVTADTISVVVAGTPVAGTTMYRGDYLEFAPDNDLLAGATYTVTVSGTLLDPAGLPLATNNSWEFTTDSRSPVGSWSETSQDQPPPAMSGASAVWTGAEMLIWGNAGAGSYDPATDSWSTSSAIAAGGPSPRIGHTAVWTGTEMVVWGGRSSVQADAEIFGGGAIFDVAANTWTEIPPPDGFAPHTFDHVAVWTGTEMIVWGGSSPGAVNSGWRYDPSTGVATAFRGTNAPSNRTSAQAVWTGSEMIVWGGYTTAGVPLNDGARYDPVADTWTPLPPVAATFTSDVATSVVWTGSEMILWNGGQTEEGQTLNDRLRVPTLHAYDPLLDAWRVSTSGWEPFLAGVDPFAITAGVEGYRAFWTGDRMFVMSVYLGGEGYFYDPILDSWQAVTDVFGLGRVGAAAVWAGSRFVIWGGVRSVLPDDDGLVLQP
jgi:hypothetical protein